MTSFWMTGTSSSGTSTPRSPRATITASTSVGSRRGSRRSPRARAWRRSARWRPLHEELPHLLDVRRRPHERDGDEVHACRIPKSRSSLSLSVRYEPASAAAGARSPCGRDTRPPAITRQCTSLPPSTCSTASWIMPSSIHTWSPGRSTARYCGWRSSWRGRPLHGAGRQHERSPAEHRLAAHERAEPNLGALQVLQYRDRPAPARSPSRIAGSPRRARPGCRGRSSGARRPCPPRRAGRAWRACGWRGRWCRRSSRVSARAPGRGTGRCRRGPLRHLLGRAGGDDVAAAVAALGPRSMTQSAVLMTSRLCSMTSTVLPWSTSRCSTASSRWMSSKCRPVVGSSRM